MALQRMQRPGRPGEIVQVREILDDATAMAKQRYYVAIGRFIQKELSVNIAERRTDIRKLMKQASFIWSRLNGILFAGKPVDDIDLHAGLPDAIAQFC